MTPPRPRLLASVLGFGIAGLLAILGAFLVAPALTAAPVAERIPAVAELPTPEPPQRRADADPVGEVCAQSRGGADLGQRVELLGICALHGDTVGAVGTPPAGPGGRLLAMARGISDSAGRRLLADQAQRATRSAARIVAAAADAASR